MADNWELASSVVEVWEERHPRCRHTPTLFTHSYRFPNFFACRSRPQLTTTTNSSGKTSEKPQGEARRCYICGDPDHLARACRRRKTESTGQARRATQSTGAGTRMVKAKEDPLDFLQSDSDDEEGDIKTVRVEDRGSKPRKVLVDIQGVPGTGVIDSGADITIMGAELFKLVASVARLQKSAFKKTDKTPYTYDHQPFSLDGKLDLDVTFDDRTMHTSAYVKMDA